MKVGKIKIIKKNITCTIEGVIFLMHYLCNFLIYYLTCTIEGVLVTKNNNLCNFFNILFKLHLNPHLNFLEEITTIHMLPKLVTWAPYLDLNPYPYNCFNLLWVCNTFYNMLHFLIPPLILSRINMISKSYINSLFPFSHCFCKDILTIRLTICASNYHTL